MSIFSRLSRFFAPVFSLLVLLAFAPRSAEASDVDLQLVLAVDVSGSVNHTRFVQQQRGYVDAFRNPRVLKAIRSGDIQAIAVMMTQWTGPSLQVEAVGWTRIYDEASMNAFADAISLAPRRLFSGGTSISGAIDHSVAMFAKSPYGGGRRVIDISGDGANNRGRPVTAARDDAVAAGFVINGLPILALEPRLDEFYQSNVIGGPNAFTVPAASFEEFAEAILKKLVTEIAAPQLPGPLRPHVLPARATHAARRLRHSH